MSLLSKLGLGKKGPRPVLVVDDDPDIRAFIGDVLAEAGYAVVHAAEGFEGVERFKSESPRLVLLDVRMPGWNGMQALTAIRKLDEGKDVPILMITAEQKGRDVDEAFRRGANDYVIKPVEIRRLLEKVRKYAPPDPP